MMQTEIAAPTVMQADKQPTALITDAGRGSAIAIIRSLARQGWRTIAADSDPHSLGFHSRYSHTTLVYPSPVYQAHAFAEALAKVAAREAIDLIIPTTDEAILPLAAARQRFEGLCKVAIPGEEELRRVTDKEATLALARSLGVPTPTTYLAHTLEEALDVAHLLPWPVVLKAQRSRRLAGDNGAAGNGAAGARVLPTGRVGYANNVQQLAAEFRRLQGESAGANPVLMQQYSPGSGQGVELLAHQGRILAAFQHRRLAEIPITGGASALRQSVPLDPQLFAYSQRLVEALHWTGLLMVEFKVDDASRQQTTNGHQSLISNSQSPTPNLPAVLMEINGRVWGSLPLAVHSGMDFPARLAHLYRHGPPPPGEPPATQYRVGLQVCNLDLMLLWIAQVAAGRRRYSFIPQPRRRQALRGLLGLLDPRRRYDVQTLRDPMPGILQLWRTLARLRRKAVRDE